jgi:hypothetical protein
MPELGTATPTRAGLPDPTTIVGEAVLRPRGRTVISFDAAPAIQPVTYRIIRTNQTDPKDEAGDEAVAEPVLVFAVTAIPDTYDGEARMAAKLSIVGGEPEVFDDLADLIATLPAHDAMRNHVPRITTDADSGRVVEENRQVRVRAFLYAASREDDRDYHLIVGRHPSEPEMYMTMEISGLPEDEDDIHFDRLQMAREAYKDFFGEGLPGTSYDFYDPPIEVEIEGSLFFDMSHATGSRPGPQSLRDDMPVVWEIHPISEIVFEP